MGAEERADLRWWKAEVASSDHGIATHETPVVIGEAQERP
jgi:hypothetical protein